MHKIFYYIIVRNVPGPWSAGAYLDVDADGTSIVNTIPGLYDDEYAARHAARQFTDKFGGNYMCCRIQLNKP